MRKVACPLFPFPFSLTGHNYGWLIYKGKKILRAYYSHEKGDVPEKMNKL
jgi:hypothetical protein